VKLSRRFSKKVTVRYATVNGAAKAPADLTARTGRIVFKPRQTTKKIAIAIKGDVLDEANETFKVKLTRPTRARIADATGVGTIVDNDALPTLSISDADPVAEGDAGSTPMNFEVALNVPSGRTVTVVYAASSVDADGTDFTATGDTLTFLPGQTVKPVAVPIMGDTEDELDEAVLVTLSAPSNATLAVVSNSGTIVDDDGPQITITEVEVVEGNDTHTANLDVELSAPSGQVVTVEWQVAEAVGQPALETATAGADFTASSAALLTFPADDTSETIAVEISGDVDDEADEMFAVMLSEPVNAESASETLITIDDDDGPTLSVNDAPIVGEGAGNMTFTVTLSASSPQPVSVDYATANSTATAGSDYSSTTGTLVIPADTPSDTIEVPITDDSLDEDNEFIFLNLSDAEDGTILDGQGVGTIVDNDNPPAVSIAPAPALSEGNVGTTLKVFPVTLNTASSKTVTVGFGTTASVATPGGDPNAGGEDFEAQTGTVTFLPGDTSENVSIEINGDTVHEPGELVTVSLTGPSNAIIGGSFAGSSIVNDDAAPAVSINDVTAAEGDSSTTPFGFSVTQNRFSQLLTQVGFNLSPGTATAGSDYTSTSGSLQIPPGSTSNNALTVNVLGDTTHEANETFNVNLTGPVNATIADGLGVGTITNDDPPVISIASAPAASEGHSGTTLKVFPVTLNAPSSETVTVGFNTTASAATPGGDPNAGGEDFEALTGTVTFLPGDTSESVSIEINGDTVHEPTELVTVTLSGPSNATISPTAGSAGSNINNDDVPPAVFINDVTAAEGAPAATTPFGFTVTQDRFSQFTTTVSFNLSPGTATAGSDYTSTSGSLQILPGSTSNNLLSINVLGDAIHEMDETFNVNLTGPTNATMADGLGVGTITDDDPLTVSINNDAQVVEGNSGTTPMTFTVSLNRLAQASTTVFFNITDGTATSPADYSPKGGAQITIPAMQASNQFSISIVGDVLDELDETFNITLNSATQGGLGSATSSLGTIIDNDP
jgi:hypothetical protein